MDSCQLTFSENSRDNHTRGRKFWESSLYRTPLFGYIQVWFLGGLRLLDLSFPRVNRIPNEWYLMVVLDWKRFLTIWLKREIPISLGFFFFGEVSFQIWSQGLVITMGPLQCYFDFLKVVFGGDFFLLKKDHTWRAIFLRVPSLSGSIIGGFLSESKKVLTDGLFPLLWILWHLL